MPSSGCSIFVSIFEPAFSWRLRTLLDYVERALNARDNHLHADYREDQPHETSDDLDDVFPEQLSDPFPEKKEGQGNHAHEGEDHRGNHDLGDGSVGDEVHRGRDRAGTGHDRYRQWRNSEAEFLGRFSLVGFHLGGVAADQFEPDKKDEDSPRDTERGEGQSEEMKNQASGHAENRNDEEGGENALDCDLFLDRFLHPLGQAQVDRRVRDRVHDGEKAEEHFRRENYKVGGHAGEIVLFGRNH